MALALHANRESRGRAHDTKNCVRAIDKREDEMGDSEMVNRAGLIDKAGGGEVEWYCPNCGERNVDWPHLTVVPLCGECDEDFDWEEIAPND